jgi:hypothetical protein
MNQKGYQENKRDNRCHRLLVSVLDEKNGKRAENCHDKRSNGNEIPQLLSSMDGFPNIFSFTLNGPIKQST